MGIVNFDYNKLINGEKDHRIGKWATKLSAVIEDTMLVTEKDYELTNLLYNVADSDSAFESMAIEDGIGLMYATLDGNKPKVDQSTFIGMKQWKHIPYTLQIQFTRQLIRDAHYALKPDQAIKARQIPSSYYKTREKIAQLGYIMGEQEVLSFNGGDTPLTTYDGKPLFHKQHSYGAANGHAQGTQSNLFYVVDANPSSGSIAEYIQQASINIRQMKDSNGDAQQFTGDTLLIPGNVGKMELATRQALGTDFWPGGNNNDINPQAGRWNFKVLPDWELDTSDAKKTFEFICLSQDAKENMASMFWNREDLEVTANYDDNTKIYNWNAYARFSLGHANYRHAVRVKIFNAEPADASNYTKL